MDIFNSFEPVGPAYGVLADMMEMYKGWYERERKETARLSESVAERDVHLQTVLQCTSMEEAQQLHRDWLRQQTGITLVWIDASVQGVRE